MGACTYSTDLLTVSFGIVYKQTMDHMYSAVHVAKRGMSVTLTAAGRQPDARKDGGGGAACCHFDDQQVTLEGFFLQNNQVVRFEHEHVHAMHESCFVRFVDGHNTLVVVCCIITYLLRTCTAM